MGSRRKARECALQMLFAADVAGTRGDQLARTFWSELSDGELEPGAQEFATRLAMGTLAHLDEVDERIKSRAEHWRISRMALVDRNLLRLAVYEFLHESTPRTVTINEALEIARSEGRGLIRPEDWKLASSEFQSLERAGTASETNL